MYLILPAAIILGKQTLAHCQGKLRFQTASIQSSPEYTFIWIYVITTHTDLTHCSLYKMDASL